MHIALADHARRARPRHGDVRRRRRGGLRGAGAGDARGRAARGRARVRASESPDLFSAVVVANGVCAVTGQVFLTLSLRIEEASLVSLARTIDVVMAFVYQTSPNNNRRILRKKSARSSETLASRSRLNVTKRLSII